MSTALPLTDPPAPSLASLRAELDHLDDALHDLVMQRATVVAGIANLRAKGPVPLRPGREAAIARRLLARHRGPFPAISLLRMWRELICGMTVLQNPLRIAVADASPTADLLAAAREHFGPLTPVRHYPSPSQAIHEVSAALATAAVLPLPREDEPRRDAWWLALLHHDDHRIHVVARLPFWTPRPEGAPRAGALVVGTAPPDPSGADRTLLGLELALETSRARLAADLAAAGLTPGATILRRDPGSDVAHALVELDGFITEDDSRLARLPSALRPAVILGAYPIPIGTEP